MEIWVLGALGRTGRAITAELERRDVPIVLVGRNRERLAATGAKYVVADGVEAMVAEIRRQRPAVVVNTIGEYAATAPTIARACLPGGHYVDMAADLVAMTEAVVPGEFVLVAHSMGGLVARRAAERLGSRLRGLQLVDPTPETSPVYDTWDRTTQKIDRALAVTQALSRFRPPARLFSANVRHLFSVDTYQTMLAENFTPAGTSQTRKEMQAVAAAIPRFRAQPPQLPKCPTVVLSAGRAAKGRERQNASMNEHQRRYAESLPDGRHEQVDSAHFIQAEQPQLIATRIKQLLQTTTSAPVPATTTDATPPPPTPPCAPPSA